MLATTEYIKSQKTIQQNNCFNFLNDTKCFAFLISILLKQKQKMIKSKMFQLLIQFANPLMSINQS